MFENMKTCASVGMFPQENTYLRETKLMQQFYEYIARQKIQQQDFTPFLTQFLTELQVPAHLQDCVDQSKLAQRTL